MTREKPKRSLRGAINAYCRSCLYDPRAAGLGPWRMQVAACTARNCPLWPVRPTSRAETDEEAEDHEPESI